MSVTHGMNLGEVDSLGRLMLRSGDRLRALVADVDRLVYATDWGGDDGAGFLQSWPTYKSRLLVAADGIGGLGQAALNNVTEQAQASGDGVAGWMFGAHRAIAGGSAAAIALTFAPGAVRIRAAGEAVWSFVDNASGAPGAVHFAMLMRHVDLPFTPAALQEMLGARVPVGAVGGVVGGISIGYEGVQFYEALRDGNAGQAIGHGVGIGVTALGMVNPYVAAGSLAWDIGYGVGTHIAQIPAVEGFMVDTAFDEHLFREYGTTDLTPSQAAEASRRYDGIGGFVNYGSDVATSTAKRLDPRGWFD